MGGARVTHDGRSRFFVDGASGLEWANDVLGGPLDVVGPASLTSLRNALHDFMIKLDGEVSEDPTLRLSSIPAEYLDHDWAEWDAVSLTLEESCWSIDVQIWRDESFDEDSVARLMEPLLERHKAVFAGCGSVYYEGGAWEITLSAIWQTRGKTVADAVAVGKEMQELMEASVGGTLTPATAKDLITSGHAQLLRGQPEGQWLDAKGAPYALSEPKLGPRDAWELAKDVAAFANSPTGGLILLGATTRDRGDGETIAGFREFELVGLRRQAYRNHVSQKVFPRVAGFEVCGSKARIPATGSDSWSSRRKTMLINHSSCGVSYATASSSGHTCCGRCAARTIQLPFRSNDYMRCCGSEKSVCVGGGQ